MRDGVRAGSRTCSWSGDALGPARVASRGRESRCGRVVMELRSLTARAHHPPNTGPGCRQISNRVSAQGLKRFQLHSHLASDTHRAALHPGHRHAIAWQRCNQPADFPATTAPKLHSSCTCLPSGKRSPGTPGLSTAKYVMPISLPLKHQNLFFSQQPHDSERPHDVASPSRNHNKQQRDAKPPVRLKSPH